MGEKTRADLAECVDQAASLIAAAKIVHIGTAQRKIEAALNPDRWEKLVRGLREAARALRSTPEADPRFAVERGFDGEPVIVEQPSSPLLALAEELERRADNERKWAEDHPAMHTESAIAQGRFQVLREAAKLARDYATREERK